MQILTDIGQFLLVCVVAFVALCVLASYLRFQRITRFASTAEPEALDSREAFLLQLAAQLGTVHRAPEPFGVFLIEADRPSADALEEIDRHIVAQVRQRIRRTDQVGFFSAGRIGVIVEAGRRHSTDIANRIVSGLSSAPCRCATGLVLKVAPRIGISTYPENGDRAPVLIEQAEAALGEATREAAPAIALQSELKREFASPGEKPDSSSDAQEAAPHSVVDELTGVLRSDRLPATLHKFVAQFRKEEKPVSFLYLDIDYFKRYNDHHGREAGDRILRGFGELLQASVREEDLIGRVSGEEFVIAMGCSAKEALGAAQRLGGVIKKTIFPVGGASLKISVSIGVAGYPEHGMNAKRLLDTARIALDTTKTRGPNTCLLYDFSMQKRKKTKPPIESF